MIDYYLVFNVVFFYRYIINEPEYCQHKLGEYPESYQMAPVDILILVSSAVPHQERREAIRSTWGSSENLSKYNCKLLFLLGQGKDHQGAIFDESQSRRDIIQEDFHVISIM